MSFWKKIGLADKDDFKLLHSEIEKLREDNRLMAEQNHRLMELLINQRYGEINSLISSGIERVERNVSEVAVAVGECGANGISKVEACEGRINHLEEVIDKAGIQMTERLSSELEKAESSITDACAGMKSELVSMNREIMQNHESKTEQFVENLISQKNHVMQNDILTVIKSVERTVSEVAAVVRECNADEISKVEECEAQINHLEEVIGKAGIQMTECVSFELGRAESSITDACAKMKADLISTDRETIQNHESKMEQFVENLVSQKNNIMQNDILTVVNEQALGILRELSQLQTGMGESAGELSIIMDRIQNTLNTTRQEIEDGILKTAKTEELEKILSDMELVRESLSNLWTVMKAIWVDSLLEDVEKSVSLT